MPQFPFPPPMVNTFQTSLSSPARKGGDARNTPSDAFCSKPAINFHPQVAPWVKLLRVLPVTGLLKISQDRDLCWHLRFRAGPELAPAVRAETDKRGGFRPKLALTSLYTARLSHPFLVAGITFFIVDPVIIS